MYDPYSANLTPHSAVLVVYASDDGKLWFRTHANGFQETWKSKCCCKKTSTATNRPLTIPFPKLLIDKVVFASSFRIILRNQCHYVLHTCSAIFEALDQNWTHWWIWRARFLIVWQRVYYPFMSLFHRRWLRTDALVKSIKLECISCFYYSVSIMKVASQSIFMLKHQKRF